MVENKEHFRHCLLYEFQLNHNTAEAHRNLYAVFGEDCYSESRYRFYFNRFRNGDFSLDDHPRPGRPVELDDEALRSTLNKTSPIKVPAS